MRDAFDSVGVELIRLYNAQAADAEVHDHPGDAGNVDQVLRMVEDDHDAREWVAAHGTLATK